MNVLQPPNISEVSVKVWKLRKIPTLLSCVSRWESVWNSSGTVASLQQKRRIYPTLNWEGVGVHLTITVKHFNSCLWKHCFHWRNPREGRHQERACLEVKAREARWRRNSEYIGRRIPRFGSGRSEDLEGESRGDLRFAVKEDRKHLMGESSSRRERWSLDDVPRGGSVLPNFFTITTFFFKRVTSSAFWLLICRQYTNRFLS